MDSQQTIEGWSRNMFGYDSDVMLGTKLMHILGLQHRGAYDNGATYVKNDVVSHNSQWYVWINMGSGNSEASIGADWQVLSNFTVVPTNVSQLTNDAGYVTSSSGISLGLAAGLAVAL